ncbi:MAG: glycosyltransferase [Candidatus Amulumruptor caecigallinarius]|nr:glycosyltransferase [Candidatus Amulumruptor caecigallinarius]MCM1396012.1 glycosyltransferase [Candidatus Amulumruptor caecigallinarius]MCM1454552.1 glycosyltransferase [bacterium]
MSDAATDIRSTKSTASGKAGTDVRPKVSVISLTYNQADFVRRALEGMVSQQTDFPFEVVIHDDASTDGTADIIREYQARYPDIIKPILRTENLFSKERSLRTVIRQVVDATQGEYIANCEGDDYWTDPYKLAKQAAILDAHPEVSMVYTNFKRVDENDEELVSDTYVDIQKDYESGALFARMIDNNFPLTVSIMERREVFYHPVLLSCPEQYDYTMACSSALAGELYFLPEVTCAYRQNRESFTFRHHGIMTANDAIVRYHFTRAYLKEPQWRKSGEYHRRIMRSIAGIMVRKRLMMRGKFYKLLLTTPALWPYIPGALLGKLTGRKSG